MKKVEIISVGFKLNFLNAVDIAANKFGLKRVPFIKLCLSHYVDNPSFNDHSAMNYNEGSLKLVTIGFDLDFLAKLEASASKLNLKRAPYIKLAVINEMYKMNKEVADKAK